MSFFRPEFFNRLDEIVIFQPLGADTIREIARKELREIAKREGISRADLRLTWTDSLERHVARVGFDHRYGARPLQRTLEREVVAPLASWLSERPDVEAATIQLDVDSHGKIIVNVD